MFNDVASLCSAAITYDASGNAVEQLTKKDVFVKPKSIRMKEFYQAAEVGLKPEFTLVLADYYDYSGEKLVEYEGKMFDIIRTYRVDDRLELVVTGRRARQ